jgi:hypothetical protein
LFDINDLPISSEPTPTATATIAAVNNTTSTNTSKDEVYMKVSARVRPFIKNEQDHNSVIEVFKEKNQLKVFTNNYFNSGERNFYFENVLG